MPCANLFMFFSVHFRFSHQMTPTPEGHLASHSRTVGRFDAAHSTTTLWTTQSKTTNKTTPPPPHGRASVLASRTGTSILPVAFVPHIFATMSGMFDLSIDEKAKHFLPRWFSDAPTWMRIALSMMRKRSLFNVANVEVLPISMRG